MHHMFLLGHDYNDISKKTKNQKFVIFIMQLSQFDPSSEENV